MLSLDFVGLILAFLPNPMDQLSFSKIDQPSKNSRKITSTTTMTLPSSVTTTLIVPRNDDPIIHPSFDNISQSCDCDTLMQMNPSPDVYEHYREPTRHQLKCDAHRLNINESLNLVKDLKSEEPISTPPTISDSSQSPLLLFNHHRFLISHTNDHDDEQLHSSLSSTDCMVEVSESGRRDRCSSTLDGQSIEYSPSVVLNQYRDSQRILTTSLTLSSMPSTFDNCNSVSYGIDWSDRARPTSHCWFPCTSSYPSTAQHCSYATCSNRNRTAQMPLLQCGSCGLVVHAHHLNDSHATEDNLLPSCRPSFVDNPMLEESYVDYEDNPSNYDKHFWTYVSTLTKPCVYCKQKAVPASMFTTGIGQTSAISASQITCQDVSIASTSPKSSRPKIFLTSTGLLCLWCSQSYHRRCWEHLDAENAKIKCDYGLLRNIIVRPQWLHRSNQSSSGFRAELPLNSVGNHSALNHFPYTPTLLFINKHSGGQHGEEIYRKLLQKLNPRQVFLLESDTTIVNALDIYISLPNTRIGIYGGDGTVSWVLSRIADVYSSNNNPPVAICPLGTCNDLSRVLAWGAHYNSKHLLPMLLKIPQAQVTALDRWQVRVEQFDIPNSSSVRPQNHESRFHIGQILQPLLREPKFIRENNRASYQNHRSLPNTHFVNYMSFGLDAAIALEFHDRRTHDPNKFSSAWKNKLMYFNESRKYLNDFVRSRMWSLDAYIRLICDGENLTDALRHYHTLLILNIPAYVSGTNPWGKSSSMRSTTSNFNHSPIVEKDKDSLSHISTSSVHVHESVTDAHETDESANLNNCGTNQCAAPSTTTIKSNRFDPQDFGDQKLEVIGLSTRQMAAIHMGFSGTRIAQCNQLRIELYRPMTAHMDGEPFYLSASVAVNISYAGQVLMLRNENR
ncbi:unnamed protein product [Rotaria sp. Silwood2]|nr:unnamed protein product [Rotaria sp. Silwood2]